MMINALEPIHICTRSASPSQTHGPVVATGPTRGQNRSRNKNGQWRKKRSDAGKTRKNIMP